tara:strand:- start:1585 stop:3786 length:2202 start_codon:yes stop_codon:yes gene_type:complete
MLSLNAFPISFEKNSKIAICKIPYDEQLLRDLRVKHQDTYAFYRMGDKIVCVSADDVYPVAGEQAELDADNNYGLLSFLIKDAVVRVLKSQGRSTPTGFNPIEIVSTLDKDNIIGDIVDATFPFKTNCKYEIEIRNIRGKLHLVVDCSTKIVTVQPCAFFIQQGFNIDGRYIVAIGNDGFRRLLGNISHVSGNEIQYQNRDGTVATVEADKVFLEANRENFDDYTRHRYGTGAAALLEKIRIKVSVFNGGQNKKDRIERFTTFLARRLKTLNGIVLSVEQAPDISRHINLIDKSFFVFSDNLESSVKDGDYGGLKKTGPYTKRTFDRNNPSICIICSQSHQGQVEQFVRKLLKGIPGHKYFASGMEGKFHIGTSKVEVFTCADDSVAGYRAAIEAAIQKKTQDGGRWDLALVQVKQSFKDLPAEQNPYYVARSLFLLHHVAIQDFTLELLTQSDNSLGYSLNNMALASYAKMGGVPWLLKSSPTLSHELVIGIGSANLHEDRLSKSQRIMGITTVFSGDGSYIVSNTSKAVTPNQYPGALVDVLKQTIEKVKSRLNWQRGDTIRIVFHASVKKFNHEEIDAVKKVIDQYREYNIEYAFLKISEHHGLHLFNSETANESKGKFAPLRGQVYKLSDHENLVYLIGQKELKQVSDGHPRGLIVSIHRDSTFKDIKYLTDQLFNFSAHSWRSYFPNPMPVTITYSDLIAHHLGWLNKIPGWNDTVMHSKIGQTQWFL